MKNFLNDKYCANAHLTGKISERQLTQHQYLWIWQGSLMRIQEIERKPKKRKAGKASDKTDWERNLTKLRSKKRQLKPQSPVKPVSLVR
ncbi:hypothetical protein [Marivita cryptomonadis]|uniref:hypothetical protein n=1 Tax=Marivita cryptomonadis TaxID=505252 RepID=UPI00111C3519|nr:hypothetical protein [Marivita cryptomonadis]